MQRIGVYGGTFDPIHNGHFEVAGALLEYFAMDRMLFVPAYEPPHKRGQTISSQYHRLAMLALATADAPRMFISTIELEAPSRPYTIETLQRLQSDHKDSHLFFIMGGDSFKDITMWREYERILSEYDVIVAMRPGFPHGQDPAAHLAGHLQKRAIDLRDGVRPPEKLPAGAHIYLTDYVEIDVSSTDVREFAAQGRGIDDLVPAPVAAYIAKYNLYQNSECQKS